ncbi:hypothetical protein KI387_018001, partial [Taxus chinensis]
MGSILKGLKRRCECCVSTASAEAGHSQQLPEDVVARFEALSNSSSVDELITEIKELLQRQKERLRKKEEASTSSQNRTVEKESICSSLIESGAKFFKIFNDHLEKFDKKGDGRAVAKEFLAVVGSIHWLIAGLSITAYLLGKFDKIRDNKEECLQLLESMGSLATHVKNLKNEIPHEREKLEKAVECIAQGSIMCASQLHSKSFFRFLKTSVNSESLRKLKKEVEDLYNDLILTTVVEIKHQQPGYLPLSQPPKPDGAVGIEQSRKDVINLLNMTSTNVSSVAVVVYGYGGIGKTTLAKAVLYELKNLKETYNYTSLFMDEFAERNDLRRMQQQILMDAFPKYKEGKKNNIETLPRGEKDLREILPEDLKGLPQRSRILLTTRNLKETDMFEHCGLQRRKYAVPTLPEEEACKILLKEAVDHVDLNRMEAGLNRIVKVCGGIPLVLTIVGARLRKHNYRFEECNEILDALEEGQKIKDQDLSERLVDFVYGQLEERTQEAFLDICCYFNNWKRRYVEYIVGTEHLQSLEEAALVSSTFSSSWEFNIPDIVLNVHDVIRAKGRSMSEGSRIMNVESFEKAKEDEASLKKIKGFRLMQDKCIVEERHLDLMRNSLRVLILGDGVSVGGRSHKAFPELRCLETDGNIPVRLEALNKLAFYYGPLFIPKDDDVKLPKNIQMLKAKRQRKIAGDAKPIKSDSDCSLKELNLEELNGGDMMSTTGVPLEQQLVPLLDEVRTLEILIFDDWGQMKELPDQVCRLSSLSKLSMEACDSLEFLPESFGLPSSLTYLSLGWCDSLKELPSTIGQLSSLQTLWLSGCSELKELPSTIGQLSSLQTLRLVDCWGLKKLPSTIGQLNSLQTLILAGCSELKKLPTTIGQLSSLQTLSLEGCRGLKELPSTIGQLSSLQTLWLSGCSELKELPSTIGQLRYLQTLRL